MSRSTEQGSGVLLRICRRRREGDSGMALVLVVGSMLVLMMLARKRRGDPDLDERVEREDRDDRDR